MTQTTFKKFYLLSICVALLFAGQAVFAQSVPQVQTNSATNIQNNSATLNGYLNGLGTDGNISVYFQWGTTTSYGNQTISTTPTSVGLFSQIISGLSSNTTYHFEAVAQNGYGTVYGQDMTFYTGAMNVGGLTANAGPDLYLSSGQTSTLQGSSNIPGSNYSWSCTGGNLSNYNIAQPVYTAPYAINGNNQATYICTLTVSNGSGSSSDSTTIYVNYNGNNYNNGNFYVQTNSPTYVQNNSATLNGTLSSNNSYYYSYYTGALVWFQWGTDTNYGSSSFQETLGGTGTFMQEIANLNPNTTYHYRAVAQVNGQTIYGQDMTFNSSGSVYYGTGTLTISKQVINLSSGNLNWQASVNGNPGDVLSFAITLQAGNQDIHNVFVRDMLPSDLIYKGNLMVNASINTGENPTSGINIGTIAAGGIATIAYQATIAPSANFNYGTTTVSNNITVTSTEGGTQTASSSVIVNKQLVYGAATTVDTGLTNNPITDSFFFPVLLIILMSWLYFTGRIYKFADWMGKYI